MFTTLNPRVTEALAALSLLVFIYTANNNVFSVLTFILGILVSFPIIYNIWVVMEKNWKSLYKKFYSKRFHNRNTKLVKKSLRLTWWVVPWSIIIYSVISFAIIRFDTSMNLLFSYIFGAIFIIAVVTNIKSRKYYEEIK